MAAIVHGTYRTEKVEGFVADFCPVCRDIEPFQVIRVGDASHLFFVSLGNARFAGHLLRCAQCGTGREYEAERYSGIAQQPGDKQALIEMTCPNVRQEFGERLALEEKLRKSPAAFSAHERQALLLEPFRELDREIEQLDKGTLQQKQARMWGVLAMMLAMGTSGALFRFREDKTAWIVTCGIFAFVGVWFGILIVAEIRGMKRRIVPSLARALRPLRPTREELQMILDRCRAVGLHAGKKVRLSSLWTALQTGAA